MPCAENFLEGANLFKNHDDTRGKSGAEQTPGKNIAEIALLRLFWWQHAVVVADPETIPVARAQAGTHQRRTDEKWEDQIVTEPKPGSPARDDDEARQRADKQTKCALHDPREPVGMPFH